MSVILKFHCTVHISNLTKLLFAKIPRVPKDSHNFSHNIVMVNNKFRFLPRAEAGLM